MRMADLFVMAAGTGGSGGGGSHVLFGLVLMLVVFYGIVLSGNRREKKKRQEMLAAIGKNDRVMTIGGILGSVVTATENEVTIKVDESANVKITVTRSAIQRVLADDENPGDVR